MLKMLILGIMVFGLLATGLVVIIVVLAVASLSLNQPEPDCNYRYNGMGNPYTCWDEDGDFSGAPFQNEIYREENW